MVTSTDDRAPRWGLKMFLAKVALWWAALFAFLFLDFDPKRSLGGILVVGGVWLIYDLFEIGGQLEWIESDGKHNDYLPFGRIWIFVALIPGVLASMLLSERLTLFSTEEDLRLQFLLLLGIGGCVVGAELSDIRMRIDHIEDMLHQLGGPRESKKWRHQWTRRR